MKKVGSLPDSNSSFSVAPSDSLKFLRYRQVACVTSSRLIAVRGAEHVFSAAAQLLLRPSTFFARRATRERERGGGFIHPSASLENWGSDGSFIT